MKPPLNHMMINADGLADEFDAILGYRTSHAGIVNPGGATYDYYISTTGSGSGDGSLGDPFRTAAELPTLAAGERVGFKRGDTWTGADARFTVNASGAAGNRIVFGAYGNAGDAKPVLDSDFGGTTIINALDRNYLRFENLHVKNQQDIAGARSFGFGSTSTATVHDIELYEVETTDAYGSGDDGIYCSRNVNLALENCTFRGSENHVAYHASAGYTIAVTALNCHFETASVASFGWNSTGTTSVTATGCTWYDCMKATQIQTATLVRCGVTVNGATNRPSAIDATTATLRYCLIDYTAATTANTQFISSGTSGQTYTLQNCTLIGNNAGSQRGAVYAGHATNTLTLVNCALVRWWRAGFSTSTLETADYCYVDGLTSDGLDTKTNHITTAGYCDLSTGRPGTNLTTANKGTDLALGALVDYAGDAVTVATPTRGCYENAA